MRGRGAAGLRLDVAGGLTRGGARDKELRDQGIEGSRDQGSCGRLRCFLRFVARRTLVRKRSGAAGTKSTSGLKPKGTLARREIVLPGRRGCLLRQIGRCGSGAASAAFCERSNPQIAQISQIWISGGAARVEGRAGGTIPARMKTKGPRDLRDQGTKGNNRAAHGAVYCEQPAAGGVERRGSLFPQLRRFRRNSNGKGFPAAWCGKGFAHQRSSVAEGPPLMHLSNIKRRE